MKTCNNVENRQRKSSRRPLPTLISRPWEKPSWWLLGCLLIFLHTCRSRRGDAPLLPAHLVPKRTPCRFPPPLPLPTTPSASPVLVPPGLSASSWSLNIPPLGAYRIYVTSQRGVGAFQTAIT